MQIFFFGMNRGISLGLPLQVAIAEGDRVPLQGAASPAQIGYGSSTYIHITVSMVRVQLLVSHLSTNLVCPLLYPSFLVAGLRRVMTRDQTPVHNTIFLGKFAKSFASAVGRFMEVSKKLSGPGY